MAIQAFLDGEGTQLTKGIASARYDRGRRRAFFTGMTNTPDDCYWGVLAAIDNAGLYHNSVTGLPLSRVSVTKWGYDKAWGWLYYDRRHSKPAEEMELAAKMRANRREPKLWYRWAIHEDGSPAFTEGGRPCGKLDTPDKTSYFLRPKPYIWNAIAASLYLPTHLATNPFSEVAELVGTINADKITFAGKVIDPGQLRFDSIDIDWYRRFDLSGSQNRFDVFYSFTFLISGHVEQKIDFDWDNGEWFTREFSQYESHPFQENFPAHT